MYELVIQVAQAYTMGCYKLLLEVHLLVPVESNFNRIKANLKSPNTFRPPANYTNRNYNLLTL
jgi:hypothetical protein